MVLLLLEAVEASRCRFFENWLMKHKFFYLLKPLGMIIQNIYRSFYPSDQIYFIYFTMRHPVNTYFVLFIKTWNVDNVKRYFDDIGVAFNKEKHYVNESLNKAVFWLKMMAYSSMYFSLSDKTIQSIKKKH